MIVFKLFFKIKTNLVFYQTDSQPLLDVRGDGAFQPVDRLESNIISKNFLYDILVCFFLFWVAESARGLVVGEIAPFVMQLHGDAVCQFCHSFSHSPQIIYSSLDV